MTADRMPVDLDGAQQLCEAAGSNRLEVEYDTCDCDYPCDHKPFAVGIRVRGGTARLDCSDFVPAVWVEAIAKAPAVLGQLVAELRECRIQRDENLANIRRIDDLRIAETARIQRELDAAQAEVERKRRALSTIGDVFQRHLLPPFMVTHGDGSPCDCTKRLGNAIRDGLADDQAERDGAL